MIDMSKIVEGTVLYDCDPRNLGRTVTVTRLDNEHLRCRSSGGRLVTIAIARVHTDDTVRRKGFNTNDPRKRTEVKEAAA